MNVTALIALEHGPCARMIVPAGARASSPWPHGTQVAMETFRKQKCMAHELGAQDSKLHLYVYCIA